MVRISNFFFFLFMPVVMGSVLLSHRFDSFTSYPDITLVGILIFLLLGYWLNHNRIGSFHHENAAFYLLFIFALGIGSFELGKSSDKRNNANHFHQFIVKNKLDRFVVRIDKAQAGKNTNRVECEVIGIIKDNKMVETCGRVLLFLRNGTKSSRLRPGIVLSVEAELKPIQNYGNSFFFDWKKHYEHKGIYHQGFAKAATQMQSPETLRLRLIEALEFLRIKLKQRLKTHVHNAKTYSLLSAMILGDKSTMSTETRNRFSKSGAMHILAVSGLHVGIVYLMLSKLCQLIQILIRKQINPTIFIVSGIWLYALITGCSASVLRAAFMFTLLAFARSTNRRADMINLISCSACLLTLLDPLIVYQIGFQLSHLAVAGIVLLYPYINALISFKYKVISHLWSLISVSMAAQLSTFPLAVYYFDIFPNYFLLSNLIAVPMSSVIISTGMALLVFSDVESIAFVLSNVLSVIVDFLRHSLGFISQLPGSVLVLEFDIWDVLLTYACLVFLIVLLNQPGKRQLYLFMVAVVLSLLTSQTKELMSTHSTVKTEKEHESTRRLATDQSVHL